MGAASNLITDNIKNGLRQGKKSLKTAIAQLQVALDGIEYRGDPDYQSGGRFAFILGNLQEQARLLRKVRVKHG